MRELVQENVELIQGHPATRQRRRGRRVLPASLSGGWLALSGLLLSFALLGSSELISARSRAVPAAAPAVPPRAALSSSAAPRPVKLAGVVAPEIDAAVFPLAVRKIALDAGHGGSSAGTQTPYGLLEKDITLDVARRLQHLLEENGAFQVVMTRQDDQGVSLADRARSANRAGADIFLSIHVNWIEKRESRGVETYFLGPTNDPFLTRLAATENRDSGYSMADMRQLLDRIYAGVRQDKSRKLAEMVQASLFRSLGKVNPKVENRGVKSAPFIVLLSTEMPAILAEVSCLSNDQEAALLAKPLYRQYIAEALAAGLRSYAGLAQGTQGADDQKPSNAFGTQLRLDQSEGGEKGT